MRFLLFLLLFLPCCGSLPPLAVPPGENPERWREEITALIETRPTLEQPVVFVGSSSIRLWKSLAVDMDPLPVINFGFGGSRIFDSIYWLDALLDGVRPRALVVFSGTNDLAGENPREPGYVVDQFDALVERFRALGHEVPLLYIAISPTPAREPQLTRVLDVNRRIAARCAQGRGLHFMDTASALLDANGRPDPQWFVADRLHLNASGYASWAETVRPALLEALRD